MKKRFYKVIIINLFLIIILLAYYLISIKTDFYIPCVFRLITGYKCPGCGITTYLFDIINLRISDAFNDNQLVFILLPMILTYYIASDYCYIKYNDRYKIKLPSYIWYILIVIVILFGILRNIWNF